MYSKDISPIISHAYSSSQGLYDVIEFAMLTIRRPISLVGSAKLRVRTQGIQNGGLTEPAAAGLLWSYAYKDLIARQLRLATSVESAMSTFLCIKGIGLAKSAFCAQLVGYPVGCLDTWNLKELGVKEPTLNKQAGKKHWSNAIGRYIELQQHKTAEQWWDDWCYNVAGNRHNKSLPSAEKVSNYHVEVITQ